MKTKKPIIIGSLLLCVMLVAGVLLFTTTRATGEASETPELTLSNETAQPGEDVAVTVDLAENPGLMVMMYRVSYDHARLALTGVTGVGLNGWDVNGDTILWLGNADSRYNGTILKLNFHVLDGATAGETEVTLDCKRGDVGNHAEESFLPNITAGSVTVQGEGGAEAPAPAEVSAIEIPFTDVYESSYYYTAVCWAYENGITYGRGIDTFDPDGTCNRAETVTFLWRAAGSPEPAGTNNPFTDVKESDWFCKPVLWAYEKGITCGTSESRFSPQQTCSTAEVVTFLYRSLGIGSDGWYEEAGDWANSAGLLNETNLLVDPNEACPRSAVVTMLYRWSQSR